MAERDSFMNRLEGLTCCLPCFRNAPRSRPPPAAERRRAGPPSEPSRPADDVSNLEEEDPPEEAEDLRFQELDLLVSENRKAHRTEEYADPKLIVRRGEPFSVLLSLSTKFDKSTDNITVNVWTGNRPQKSKGTFICPSTKENTSSQWDLVVEEELEKSVKLKITPDAEAVVGTYAVMVDVERIKSTGKTQRHRKKTSQQFIILFNAFCNEDDVYMENDKEREEYVMSDTGLVFTSVYRPRHWNYGQFEEGILAASLYLLEASYLEKHTHGNIIEVLRALSGMVNVNDDSGVLVGNWSGNYEDGVSPTAWNGSIKILRQYMENKVPVRYGQCWVFAAVVTTVSRALGIPCRPVTNFDSAHDTDKSCTIDKYYTDDGKEIPEKNNDSVWNFHVWNEAFTKRPDLPAGYDGWQAFDATPQERSQGTFRCGPCPVSAIRSGNIHIGYDTPFVFAEVNADRVYWKVAPGKDPVVMDIDKDAVGRDMSTKAVGLNFRQDVTKDYKPREGNEEERESVLNALRHNKKMWRLLKDFYIKTASKYDVTFDLQPTIDEQENAEFSVKITNDSQEERNVTAKLVMYATYTTDNDREFLFNTEKTITLAGKTTDHIKWEVAAVDYFSKLDDDAKIMFSATCKVDQTEQIWHKSKVLEVSKPDIDIQLSKERVKRDEEFEVVATFKNPVPLRLERVEVDAEGPGLVLTKKFDQKASLGPNETLRTVAKMKATAAGHREVIVGLDSKELQGISNSAYVEVEET